MPAPICAGIHKHHKGTMKKETITIAGKKVTLSYCFATEIAYKDYTGENISDYMKEAIAKTTATPPQMPDVKKTMYIILAAMMAYYASKDQEAPVKDGEIMTEATPQELGAALGTVLSLYAQFYAMPEEMKGKESKRKGKGKN